MATTRIIRRFRLLRDVIFGTPATGDVAQYDSGPDKIIVGPLSAEHVTVTPFSTIGATNAQDALEEVLAEAAGVTDHGALSGLGDNDHPQYQLAATAATDAELAAAVAAHDADTSVHGIADTTVLATDAEVAAAVAAHEAAGDPHPTYTTGAEVAGAILTALSAADGSGLGDNGSGVLSVNVDGSTIEISADAIRVKAGGITTSHLSFDPATQAELDAVAAALAAHIADAVAAHAASAIAVTPFASIAANTVQAALEEIVAETAGADDQTAAEVPFTPAGNIAASNTQAAIEELDAEKATPAAITAAVAAHEAAGDPHPTYTTAAELAAAIAAALAAADGAGLSDNGSGVLAVNVDDSTIEISSDALRVKALGIGTSHIAAGAVTAAKVAADVATQAELDAAIAAHEGAADPHPDYTLQAEVEALVDSGINSADGAGLADDGAGVLSVNVDDATIEISTDVLRVKAGGIGANEIGANAVGSSELANDAVDTAAIQNNAVTAAKVAADVATQAELDAVAAAAQPLDADLTAIAALTTDAAGRSILPLTDPGADRIAFWDDSDGIIDWLTAGSGLSITGKTITASGGGVPDIQYESRSTNTILGVADKGKTIDITAAITQTFEADETLGDGWWVILRNATDDGSVEVVLNPAGTETIDGLTTATMYAGETRLIVCNGAAGNFASILLSGGYRKFTADANFVVPHGITTVTVEVCGAGGGGGGGRAAAAGNNRQGGSGGGGGAKTQRTLAAALLGNPGDTIAVDVGAGGTPGGSGADGGVGSPASFGSLVASFGGGGGRGGTASTNAASGGSGGGVGAPGVLGADNANVQGGMNPTAALAGQGGSGGAGHISSSAAGIVSAEWGGGAGGRATVNGGAGVAGAASVHGGGGGGGGGGLSTGNTETTGAIGGNSGTYGTGGGGAAGAVDGGGGTPGTNGDGGGGGGSQASGTGGAGGDGGAPGGGGGGGGAGTAAGGAGGTGGAGEVQVWYS